MFIDSHAHLSSEELFYSIEEICQRAENVQIEAIVNICTDAKTLERGIELKKRNPRIFLAAATTPHDVEKEGESFFPLVEKAIENKHLIAIGETGLDYYYEHSPKDLQKKYLFKYFELAKKTHLPLIFHCREAFADLFLFAEAEYKESPALVHCFTGTLDEARRALDQGWFISFSGIITFKKSDLLREVVKYVPLDRMLIETDSPYLAPQSKRGSVNEPSFIIETAKAVALIKQTSLEEVSLATKNNALAFFSF